MKVQQKFLIFILLLFSIVGLHAQPGNYENPVLPLKQNGSPLFGKDIVINNQPNQDQRHVAIHSAYNGWLFSTITYVNTNNFPAFSIIKSIDNGISWTVLCDNYWPLVNYKFRTMDIVVLGDSIQNQKVIVAGVITTQNFDMGEGLCFSFNGVTGDYENTLLDENDAYAIALASDNGFPAINSNPSSVGLLCSKYGLPDTLLFFSSSNGGLSLDTKRIISITQKRLLSVALAYGKCLTYPNGNYFAAWQEHDNFGDVPGHIYTAHSSPYFNSAFTPPINLDSLDSRNINNCKDPAISCINGSIDNDSSNITEVVLFDALNQTTQSEDIKGYYNLSAFNYTSFNKLILSDSSHQNIQPDINFNPYDSSFVVTYYDKSTQKLPLLIGNFNFQNPNLWEVSSPGYNDSVNVSMPFPKVEINRVQKKGIDVWTAERGGGYGVSMFDSQLSTWTGMIIPGDSSNSYTIRYYPNPCSDYIHILFELEKSEFVTVSVLSMTGQFLKFVTADSYAKGKHLIDTEISNLPNGIYLLSFHIGLNIITKQLTIIR